MNLSFAYFKAKQYKESIDTAKTILHLYNDSIYKVHYRKGMAELSNSQFFDAINSWKMAKIHASNDEEKEECDRKINSTKSKEKQHEERRRKQFGNMFSAKN